MKEEEKDREWGREGGYIFRSCSERLREPAMFGVAMPCERGGDVALIQSLKLRSEARGCDCDLMFLFVGGTDDVSDDDDADEDL